MQKKKISLKDIALEANVSKALVSYVLSGKEKEKRVGAEIAKTIKEIAKKYNYKPNLLAKSLRSGKTYAIALIIADISNPFYSNIARVVEDHARKFNYTVIIGSCDEDAEKAYDLMKAMIHRQVDGFIIVPTENSEKNIIYLKELNIPFILLDRHFPELNTDFVTTNNYKASYDACEHLIKMNYKKIAILSYNSNMFHMNQRVLGYQEAMINNTLNIDKSWEKKVMFNFLELEVKTAIDDFLKMENKPDAIIFTTYGLAINSLKYFNELKLKVPNDFAIVSFGQAEIFELYYCPITYMLQPIEDLGRKAVDILLDKIKNGNNNVQKIIMPAKLIINKSSSITTSI